ncbi:MAG TPA: hypothetical protein VFQ44_28290 [Streptosporangiaceae bacterium]|nr:hypothetical protein [Streptosporangiaceae bacterium]
MPSKRAASKTDPVSTTARPVRLYQGRDIAGACKSRRILPTPGRALAPVMPSGVARPGRVPPDPVLPVQTLA